MGCARGLAQVIAGEPTQGHDLTMGGKPRAKPVSLFAAALEEESRRQLGQADTILASPESVGAAPPASRTAKVPPVPPREPHMFQRAASAVTRVFRRQPVRDHSADPTIVISDSELPSLLVGEEDDDRD